MRQLTKSGFNQLEFNHIELWQIGVDGADDLLELGERHVLLAGVLVIEFIEGDCLDGDHFDGAKGLMLRVGEQGQPLAGLPVGLALVADGDGLAPGLDVGDEAAEEGELGVGCNRHGGSDGE